jgi:hypothetical protein
MPTILPSSYWKVTWLFASGRSHGRVPFLRDRADPLEQGAGDQGLMFGYATNETDVLMPAPVTYAWRLFTNGAQYGTRVGVKAHIGMHVANFADGVAGNWLRAFRYGL